MTELNILNSVLSLGVGGIFGIVVFLMYHREQRDNKEELLALAKEHLDCRKQENESREKNTAVLTELVILIRRLNGK